MMPEATRNRRRPAATKARSNGHSARALKPAESTPARVSSGAPDENLYAAIHEAILDHRLPPGTKLKEIPLAELFGVTRSVVRKALGRLAHERVVELRTNRG